MKYVRVLSKSFLDFFRDGGIMLAGSLSYFFMMALVPFCLFLAAIFGYILGHYPGFYEFLTTRIINFFPEITNEVTRQLGKLITFKGLGSFSIALYAILSYQVFSSIENALNIIFEVKKRRTFFWSVLLSLVIVTIVIVVVLVSFIATSLIPLFKMTILSQIFPGIRLGAITAFLIQFVIPLLMVFFLTLVAYVFFPKIQVRAAYAAAGALFSSLFLEAAKHFFTWYVGTVMKFGTIYGPLSTVVVFLLWVFYSACIFLIGAEIVHNLVIRGNRR